jgi:putative Mg2+ transporter-C (MgtC) family protein
MDHDIVIRLLLAGLWGAIVGAEREYRSKSAGFRTMIMISMGSCFFTMMSILIGTGDNQDRIASNIVTGIGFLGAGVIFRGDNRVNGITTAATIWAVAAVGMGIGAGHYFASACASVLIVVVLSVLPYLENLIDRFNQSRIYLIRCTYSNGIRQQYEKQLKQHKLGFRLTKEIKEGNKLSVTWQVHGHAKNHQSFISAIQEDENVERFEY